MKPIILASASPRRKEILEKYNIPFVVEVSNADEDCTGLTPKDLVMELSLRKADAVYKNHPKDIVIGADTVVAIDNKILGKPEDDEEAYMMIDMLQGTSHQVHTGVTICSPNGQYSFAEKTNVFVKRMSKKEIEDYIATGEGRDKAGSYAIQGIFGKYIEKYEGDYDNVVGLPGKRVKEELLKL